MLTRRLETAEDGWLMLLILQGMFGIMWVSIGAFDLDMFDQCARKPTCADIDGCVASALGCAEVAIYWLCVSIAMGATARTIFKLGCAMSPEDRGKALAGWVVVNISEFAGILISKIAFANAAETDTVNMVIPLVVFVLVTFYC